MPTDTYLASLSPESLEVLTHFGPEAPVKLNTYACSVEDALLESLYQQQRQAGLIASYASNAEETMALLTNLQAHNAAMQDILTDPEKLLDYVKGFFGAEGPYPGMAVITRTSNAATYHG